MDGCRRRLRLQDQLILLLRPQADDILASGHGRNIPAFAPKRTSAGYRPLSFRGISRSHVFRTRHRYLARGCPAR
jgi:hypothetical protein